MSEELYQRDLIEHPDILPNGWHFYNIGSTTIRSLKEHKIIENLEYGDIESRKVDGLITNGKTVVCVIENKPPLKFRTESQKEKAKNQEIEVAKKLTKLLIVTDTTESLWINALTGEIITDENGHEIKAVFKPKEYDILALIERINQSIDSNNSALRPIELVNPTKLAEAVWQDIWIVSGATPENCLYTFVELFIFKYLSDLGVLKGIYSFYDLVAMYDKNTDEDVLEQYAKVIRPKIKDLFKESQVDHTTIINGTIFVSKDQKAVKGYSTVFRKVLGRFRDYEKLENIDNDFKSRLFESFMKQSISKKNWGQYFTPLKIVRAIVALTDVKPKEKICDPACGVGKFLLEVIAKDPNKFYAVKGKNIERNLTITGYDKGFDNEEQKTIILAKANMLIYLSNLIKKHPDLTEEFSNLFNDSFVLKTNSILGTLADEVNGEYDWILTNPPYVTTGSSNLKEEITKAGLERHYKINAMGVEGLFMEWIIRALKPGTGKAFIVVPDGIMNRINDKPLRKFILDECRIDAVISLPVKAFFTSLKKTYILALTRKESTIEVQKEPVFTYLVSNIGETLDSYRFEVQQNDLNEAVNLYNQFKGAKNAFISPSPRCKIQPIAQFSPDGNWSVDRWWTRDEKIKLGVMEEDNVMTLTDFTAFLEEISLTIEEYQAELKNLGEVSKGA